MGRSSTTRHAITPSVPVSLSTPHGAVLGTVAADWRDAQGQRTAVLVHTSTGPVLANPGEVSTA